MLADALPPASPVVDVRVVAFRICDGDGDGEGTGNADDIVNIGGARIELPTFKLLSAAAAGPAIVVALLIWLMPAATGVAVAVAVAAAAAAAVAVAAAAAVAVAVAVAVNPGAVAGSGIGASAAGIFVSEVLELESETPFTETTFDAWIGTLTVGM